MLTKLTFVQAQPRRPVMDAVQSGRMKLIEGLSLQLRAAMAMVKGESFVPTRKKTIVDPNTGAKSKKDMPLRMRHYFWQDEAGDWLAHVRYGARVLTISKGKPPAVKIGKLEDVPSILELFIEATKHGEFDAQIAQARIRAAKA